MSTSLPLEHYLEALEDAIEDGDLTSIGEAYTNLGLSYFEEEQYQDASQCFGQVVECLSSVLMNIEDTLACVPTFSNDAQRPSLAGQADKDNLLALAMAFNHLAMCHTALGEPEVATQWDTRRNSTLIETCLYPCATVEEQAVSICCLSEHLNTNVAFHELLLDPGHMFKLMQFLFHDLHGLEQSPLVQECTTLLQVTSMPSWPESSAPQHQNM
mmetsp:Transcript_4593/g.8285  ORF Transcript_4593/g.8285 Transcript_4593/m.8285 type:complete len:214 (-) Transcript_4593:33-674(-)